MPVTLYITVIQHRPKCSLNRLQDQGWDIPELKAHSLKSKTASVRCFVSPSFILSLAHPAKWGTYVPSPHPIPHGIKLSLLAFITSSSSSVSQSIPSPRFLISSFLCPFHSTETLWEGKIKLWTHLHLPFLIATFTLYSALLLYLTYFTQLVLLILFIYHIIVVLQYIFSHFT